MNLEAVQSWHKLIATTFGSHLRMNEEEHVRESGAKVAAVGVMMLGRFGSVRIHALGTVQLDHRLAGHVRHS